MPIGGGGAMRPSPLCRCGLRGLLDRIHPVDKGLLLIMLVLLLQSAYSIFCPGEIGPTVKEIDIIVRTSAASIFGYFLSANFIRHTASGGQTPSIPSQRTLETGGSVSPSPGEPAARIGFSDAEPGDTDPGASPIPGNAQTEVSAEDSAANCLQVVVATGIGLFCLVALLVLRNLSQWGLVSAESNSVASAVVQLRDFVSGCVGFLIGCPTHSDNQS